MRGLIRALMLMFASLGGLAGAEAQDSSPILLGMSADFSSSASFIGLAMRQGVQAGFQELNNLGGIHSRPLRLMALDDGYDPQKAAQNLHLLAENPHCMGIIGNVGTPTAVVAIPIAGEAKMAFVGAYSGAGVLRKEPPDEQVFNFRASYQQEAATLVSLLVRQAHLPPERVAVFSQRDAFGDAGYFSVLTALRQMGLRQESNLLHVRYDRGTLAVEKALAQLLLAQPSPQAVIMFGTAGPCAKLLHLSQEQAFDPIFLGVSFSSPCRIAQQLPDFKSRVIFSQVVPHFESDLPGVALYRQAMHRYDPKAPLGFESLEGFLVAQSLGKALLRVEGPITRAAVLKALSQLQRFDVGIDQELEWTPLHHQASQQIWLMGMKLGRIMPLESDPFVQN